MLKMMCASPSGLKCKKWNDYLTAVQKPVLVQLQKHNQQQTNIKNIKTIIKHHTEDQSCKEGLSWREINLQYQRNR